MAIDTLANISIYPTSSFQFVSGKERANHALNLFLDGGRVFSVSELDTVAKVAAFRGDSRNISFLRGILSFPLGSVSYKMQLNLVAF
jgi:hypothetical protein